MSMHCEGRLDCSRGSDDCRIGDVHCHWTDGNKSRSANRESSSIGKDSSGREYVHVSMDGTICSGSEFLRATAVMEGDPTGILAGALTALQALGYLGPEKFKMACAMEYIERTCLLPNDAHTCFATGTRELKLSDDLMRSYEGNPQKINDTMERIFGICTRPNQMHTCYKSGDGNPQMHYAKPEDKPKHESIIDKLNRAHI